MQKTKIIPFYDKRMFNLMDYIISNQVNNITTKKEFCDTIGFNSTNLVQVKKGIQSFKIEHFAAACNKYNIDGNWFLDKNHTMMKKVTGKKLNPIDNLKEAVSMVSQEFGKRR